MLLYIKATGLLLAIDFLTYSPVNLLITLPAFGSAVVVSVTVVCSGVVVGVFVCFLALPNTTARITPTIITATKIVIAMILFLFIITPLLFLNYLKFLFAFVPFPFFRYHQYGHSQINEAYYVPLKKQTLF